MTSKSHEKYIRAPSDIVDVGLENRFARYQYVKLLGKGTFAEVHKYVDRKTDGFVAIKSVNKVKYESGTNIGALKELQTLLELKHPNIVGVHEVFPHNDRIHMVLEYCQYDLKIIYDYSRSKVISESRVKHVLLHMLKALQHVHSHNIIHRDLKPDNIFIAENGDVKVGDFGLASTVPWTLGDVAFGTAVIPATMHHNVITLWYRPPELLNGCMFYTYAVDMWSVGCMMAEALLKQPIFPSNPSPEVELQEQLASIYGRLGTPIDPVVDRERAEDAVARAWLWNWNNNIPMTSYSSTSTSDESNSMASINRLPKKAVPPEGLREIKMFLEDYVKLSKEVDEYSVHETAEYKDRFARVKRKFYEYSQYAALPLWANFTVLPLLKEFEPFLPVPWTVIFPFKISDHAKDLVIKFLVMDPLFRLSAEDALQHPFFSSKPDPEPWVLEQ